jgi:hypothetical protein
MFGCTIGVRVQWKSSARKVIHLSTIYCGLRRLNLGVPWVLGLGLGFEPPVSL